MDEIDEIKNAYKTAMSWMSDGDMGLTELMIIIIQMQKDFLQFKERYPDNEKVPIQEARFKMITRCLRKVQMSMLSETTLRVEMGKLRTTMGFQQEIIAQLQAEIEDLKEALNNKKHFDGTSNGGL